MTTIAWDGKTLAVDSQSGYGEVIMDYKAKKLFRNIGIFSAVAVVGSYNESLAYIEDVLCSVRTPVQLLKDVASEEFSVIGIVRDTGEVWKLNGDCSCKLYTHWAFGSGADFALASMDHGKSAIEAVKYAATRDLHTNNRVQSFTVKPMNQKETK